MGNYRRFHVYSLLDNCQNIVTVETFNAVPYDD